MNLCKEREVLAVLKNTAEIEYRLTIPKAVTPLGLDTPGGVTFTEKESIKKSKEKFEDIKKQYELHKTSCSICS